MSIFLAVLAAASFGVGDFLGGMATRRARSALPVVVTAHVIGLIYVLVVLLFWDGELVAGDAGWAAAAGLAGSFGLVMLYRGLAMGTVSIVAPLSAVIGAVVPVGWGVATGEAPSPVAWAGVIIALVAVVIVASGPGGPQASLRRPGIIEGLAAGVGFGLFFILIANTTSGELWMVAFARLASITVLGAVALGVGAGLIPRREAWLLTAGAGILDVTANILFLAAERRGFISEVAVITALYPAATVLLARLVLHERLTPQQWAGLALAAVGVAFIAAG